ncbi:MAG: hypothetical protein KBD55_03060 [Candidatus Pacebacteria bacterium]|nr:hypothetical protein [Candidatus Paceibacterota bacterium]
MKSFIVRVGKIFIAVFLFLSFTQSLYAAEINFSPSSGTFEVGDTIKVRVVLSSPSQSANAISSKISFSKDMLTLTSISKSNSLVSLWALEPTYSNSTGSAEMEGIILSGYTGSNGTIVTLTFKAKASGTANLKFSSSSVLANDGQGTNILTNVGQGNLTIKESAPKPVATTPTITTTVAKEKNTSGIVIEELKKKESADSSTKFLITSTDKKPKTTYSAEIDDVKVSWDDQDGGIFQTPNLSKGVHELKISAVNTSGGAMSATVSFTITTILVPTFTEYSESVKEKEYFVAKGIADPDSDIYVTVSAALNNASGLLGEIDTVVNDTYKLRSDDKGLFTYVSDKAMSGVYEITAYSQTKSGVKSMKSAPIKITVVPKSQPVLNSLMDTFSVIIPIVAVIILLLILSIWGWYKVLHYREHKRGKLVEARSIVAKSFSILSDDINEQAKILKKIKALQPLSADEKAFITQFKKDVDAAEEVILAEIKKSEK